MIIINVLFIIIIKMKKSQTKSDDKSKKSDKVDKSKTKKKETIKDEPYV
jgi:hypothetical protein